MRLLLVLLCTTVFADTLPPVATNVVDGHGGSIATFQMQIDDGQLRVTVDNAAGIGIAQAYIHFGQQLSDFPRNQYGRWELPQFALVNDFPQPTTLYQVSLPLSGFPDGDILAMCFVVGIRADNQAVLAGWAQGEPIPGEGQAGLVRVEREDIPPTPSTIKNVVFIMADDLGKECLSRNGSSIPTPNLDTLADEGAYFTGLHVQPICTPTRYCMNTGYRTYHGYSRFREIPGSEVTLPALLKQAGVATCYTGKWQLDDYSGTMPFDNQWGPLDGFSLWQFSKAEWYMRDPRYIDGQYLQWVNGSVIRSSSGTEHADGVHVAYGIDFMRKQVAADKPFFWFCNTNLVHYPFQRTPAHPEWNLPGYPMDYIKTAYFPSMVEYLDMLVGDIVEELDALGIRDETLILFCGDNGTDERIGTEQEDGGTIMGKKSWLLTYGTNSPMIANLPGVIGEGQIIPSPIEASDFFPTILAAFNVPVPNLPKGPHDGISFLPILNGGEAVRDVGIVDYEAGSNMSGYEDQEGAFAFDGRYKLYGISFDGLNNFRAGKMYDYINDPLELVQVVNEPVRIKLQAALDGRQ